MATGQDQVAREQYRSLISEKPDRDLLIEVAMKTYDIQLNCANNNCPPNNKKPAVSGGVSGAITGIIAGIIISVINFFRGGS